MWQIPLTEEQSQRSYVVGAEYEFTTVGNASIPINVPIDIVNPKHEALGQVRVKEYNTSTTETKGRFVVVSLN